MQFLMPVNISVCTHTLTHSDHAHTFYTCLSAFLMLICLTASRILYIILWSDIVTLSVCGRSFEEMRINFLN